MLLFLLLNLEMNNRIDSLKNDIAQHPQFSTIAELNECYLFTDQFDHGIALLKKYYDRLKETDNPALCLNLGDDYLFSGAILSARDEYLKLVNRYPHSEFANDALENLLMIEQARKDTTILKQLTYALCLYRTNRLDAAQESLKTIIKTKLGDYGYYFLALLYIKKDDPAQAISALDELNENFPDHKIMNTPILMAEIYLRLGFEKDARAVLEDLIVHKPNSIYAVRAKALLKEFVK